MDYVPPIGAPAGTAYSQGDPSTGQPGSLVPAAAIEHPMRELVAVIQAASMVPAAGDLTQVTQALRRLCGGSYTAVGAGITTLTAGQAGLVAIDAGAGDATVLLPAAATLAGLPYQFVRIDASAHAVAVFSSAAGDAVDSGAPGGGFNLVGQFAARSVRADGGLRWFTVSGSGADPSRAGVLRIATSAEVAALTDTAIAVTPGALGAVTPTTTQRGLLRTATAAEAKAGVETLAALTPAALAAVLPAPAAGGQRMLAVKRIGSTADSATTSHSFTATTLAGSYTRAAAGSDLYLLALIDGQISGVYAGQDAAWQVEHFTGGAWVSAGITAVMMLSPGTVTLRAGVTCAGLLANASTAAINLRLAHRTVSDGVTAVTGSASSLLVLELG